MIKKKRKNLSTLFFSPIILFYSFLLSIIYTYSNKFYRESFYPHKTFQLSLLFDYNFISHKFILYPLPFIHPLFLSSIHTSLYLLLHSNETTFNLIKTQGAYYPLTQEKTKGELSERYNTTMYTAM